MTYTTNYHLPQWVKEDRIMMDDFNAAMANLEDGLNRAVSAAAADTSSAAAKVAAAAAAAQAAADRAIAAAAAAQATADAAYSPSQQPYVTGTYTGKAADITISLGFQPKFLIIASPSGMSDGYNYLYMTMIGGGIKAAQVELTATGFVVHSNGVANHEEYSPLTNSYGVQYAYIAFR